jgi:hypothetical protein
LWIENLRFSIKQPSFFIYERNLVSFINKNWNLR